MLHLHALSIIVLVLFVATLIAVIAVTVHDELRQRRDTESMRRRLAEVCPTEDKKK
jgi:hypothetical protein